MSFLSNLFNKNVSVPLLTPSRGGLNEIMKKVYSVHIQTGGKKYSKESEDGDSSEIKGLNPFDALKIMISKKINICRRTIREIKGKNKGFIIRKKNDVRKMIKFIKNDFNKMNQINEDYIYSKQKKGNFMMLKKFIMNKNNEEENKIDEKLVKARQEDLELIRKHIYEVEQLFKKRLKGTGNKRRNRKTTKESLFKRDITDFSNVDVLDKDEESNLPRINIDGELLQLKRNKQNLKKEVSVFTSKLNILREQALVMGENVEEGKRVLEDVENKVDNNQALLNGLNKSSEKAIKKLSKNTTLLCWIIILIVFFVIFVACYFIINGLLNTIPEFF